MVLEEQVEVGESSCAAKENGTEVSKPLKEVMGSTN